MRSVFVCPIDRTFDLFVAAMRLCSSFSPRIMTTESACEVEKRCAASAAASGLLCINCVLLAIVGEFGSRS
jgi:hypothetical protein